MSLFRRCAIALSLVALLFVGSLSSWAAPPAGDGPDLVLHAAAYGGLTLLFAAMFGHPWVLAAGLLALSGAIEGLQALIPGRVASWADMLANGVGVAGGLALLAVLGLSPLWCRLVRRLRSA